VQNRHYHSYANPTQKYVPKAGTMQKQERNWVQGTVKEGKKQAKQVRGQPEEDSN
jgi:hypothetical protein